MAKFKIIDGIFDDKRAGEVIELEPEHGAYYVREGLLEEVQEEAKPKRATKK